MSVNTSFARLLSEDGSRKVAGLAATTAAPAQVAAAPAISGPAAPASPPGLADASQPMQNATAASNFFKFSPLTGPSDQASQDWTPPTTVGYGNPADAASHLAPQLKQLGYNGPTITDSFTYGASQDAPQVVGVDPQLQAWLDSKGYQLQAGTGGQGYAWQVADKSGNPVAQTSESTGAGMDFLTAAAIAGGGILGGSALAGAAGGTGAGAAAGATGAAAGGSSDLAALYGSAGYGAGMTGAETAAYDAALAGGAGGASAAGGGAGLADAAPAAAAPATAAPAAGSNLAAAQAAGTAAAAPAAGTTAATTAATGGATMADVGSALKTYGPLVGQLYSAINQSSAANKTLSTSQAASDAALKIASDQQQFAQNQLADQQPSIGALRTQATATNGQQQQIAGTQAAAGASQLNDVTNSFSPVNQQVGLNAMGAQNLSADQVTQLQQAQQTLATSTDPAARAAAQAQIQTLQKTAESAGIGLENAKAALVTNTAADQGQQVQNAYGANADATRQIGSTLAAGTNQVAANTAGQTIDIGNADAAAALQNGQTVSGDLTAMGDAQRADQTGFYNDQAQNVLDTAKQRAIDFERDQTTQANAAISSSADQAQRQMLRLGGDPTRMAAMALDTANQQQLARIGASNQIGTTNIANLNAAHDQALGLQQTGFNAGTAAQYAAQGQAIGVTSSALDAARAARTQAQQTALGITSGAANQGLQTVASANQSAADKTLQGTTAGQGIAFAGQNQGVAITNAAKDKVDSTQNSLLGAAGGLGTQVSNSGSQANLVGTNAGTAGVGNLNTAAQSTVPMTNAVTSANLGAVQAANSAAQSVYGQTSAENQQAAGTGNLVDAGLGLAGKYFSGTSGGGSTSTTDLGGFQSSEEVKENFGSVDPDAAVEGLEQAMPKTYDYKPGQGTPGRKIGAMAEDLNKQFGNAVAPGGKMVNAQNMIGLQHAAIVGLSKRVKQLERRT